MYQRSLHTVPRIGGTALAFVSTAAVLASSAAFGHELSAGESFRIRFDNTIKYSVGWRLKSPSARLTADVNQDDGNPSFEEGGLISNRLDLLSEFDATYRNVGLRLSGAAWYDEVYNRSNDNRSPFTNNSVTSAFNRFTKATRDLHGRKAELLDAALFGTAEIGEMSLSGRAGRHALLYGESLFFGGNGIAAAQSPIDIVKLLSVPNTTFKELIRPVSQVSGQLQINPSVSIGGYYQFRWERDRLPAAGSYFSGTDILDEGGERLLLGPDFALGRAPDREASDSGQGGFQLRLRPPAHPLEYGLYAARFHAKAPIVVLDFANGSYSLLYPQDITTFGASASATVAGVNFAAEVSLREDMPLLPQGGGVVAPTGYPVGETLHAQISWIALLHTSSFWDGGSFLGEIAYHRVTSVTANEAALDPRGTRSASAIRFIFSPTYFQVIDGLDVSVPIGVGYGIDGRSLITNPGFSVEHGGDLSIGIAGDYLKAWRFGVSYTAYFGKEDGVVSPANSPAASFSYRQNLKDRNYVSLTFQKTF